MKMLNEREWAETRGLQTQVQKSKILPTTTKEPTTEVSNAPLTMKVTKQTHALTGRHTATTHAIPIAQR
jgi:hypothetical protein